MRSWEDMHTHNDACTNSNIGMGPDDWDLHNGCTKVHMFAQLYEGSGRDMGSQMGMHT